MQAISPLKEPAVKVPHSSTVDLAALLKAAGDGLRLGVLQLLAKDSYGVLELAQAFNVKQSGMSHHLKVLANVGLVTTRREGNSIFYRRTAVSPHDPLAASKHAIFQQVDNLAPNPAIQAALRCVWTERGQASEQFFVENSTKFKAQQDLIASFEIYGDHVAELLSMEPQAHRLRALEVGPGAGEFLPILSARYQHVVALDNSEQMLQHAQQQALPKANVTFALGDTSTLNNHPPFDCAVANMVLHHTPSPAQVIADISAAIKAGGTLIITELCSHQQTWARDACGDVWLGFEADDLSTWAQASGLVDGQRLFFALRNGFQIQIQQFIKQ